MNDYHIRTFTWGAGPQKVFVAGGFNNWSETATPLEMQEDGTFLVDVPLPWGERQAYKYVLDGEWMVREDEDKEWDPSGNVNNVYQAPPKPTGTAAASEAPKGTAQPMTDDRSTDAAAVPTDTTAAPVSTGATAQPAVSQTQSTGLSTGDKAAIGAGAALAGGAGAAAAANSTTSEAKKKKNKKKNEKKKAKKKAERAAAQAAGGAAPVDGDDDDEDDDDEGSAFTGTTTPATTSAFATPALDTSNQLGHDVPVTTQSTTQGVDPSARTLDSELQPVKETESTAPVALIKDETPPVALIEDEPKPVALITDETPAPAGLITDEQPAPAGLITDETAPAATSAPPTDSSATAAPITDSAVPTEAVKPPTTAQVDQPDQVLVAEYDSRDPSRNFDTGFSGAAIGTAAAGAAAVGAGTAYAANKSSQSDEQARAQAAASNPSVAAFREASHEDDVASAQTYVKREQEGVVTKTTTVTEIVYDHGDSYGDSTEALVEKREPSTLRGQTEVSTAVDSADISAADGTHLGQQVTVNRVADTQVLGDSGEQVGRQADVSQVTATQLQNPDGSPVADHIQGTNVEAFKPADTHEHETISHRAAGAVAGAAAGVAALGGAAFAAVKNATGVDIAPEAAPVSIEEAKRRGIDVEHLPQVEGPSDAVSPVGTHPPEGAVNQLQEMIDGLKHPQSVPPTDGAAIIAGSQTTVPASAATAAPIDASRSQAVPAGSVATPTSETTSQGAAVAAPVAGTAAAVGATTVPTGSQQQVPYTGGSLSPETSVKKDTTSSGAVGTGTQAQSAQGADPTQTVHGLGNQSSSAQGPATTVHGAGAGYTGDETISRSVPGQTGSTGTAAAASTSTTGAASQPAQAAHHPDPTFSKTTYDPNAPSHTRTEIIGAAAAGAAATGASVAGASSSGSHNYAAATRSNDGKSQDQRKKYDLEDEITGKTSGRDLTFNPATSYDQNQHSTIPNMDGQSKSSETSGTKAGDAPNGGKGFNGASRQQSSNVSDSQPPIGVNNKDRSPHDGEDLEPRPPTGTYGNPTNQPQVKAEVFRAQDTDIPSQRQAAAANNRTVPAPTIKPIKGPVTTSSTGHGAGGTAQLFSSQDRNVMAHQRALEEAEAKGETSKNLSADDAMAGLSKPLSNTSDQKPHAPTEAKVGHSGAGFNENPGATEAQKHPGLTHQAQQQSGAHTGVGAVGSTHSGQSQPSQYSGQQQYPGSTTAGTTAPISQQTSHQTQGSTVDAAGNIRSPTGEVVGSTTNNAGGEVGTDAPQRAAVSSNVATGAAAGGLAGVVGLAAKNVADGVNTSAAGVQSGVNSGVSGVQSGVAGVQSGSTAGLTGARDSVTSGIAGVNSSLQQGRDSVAASTTGVKSGVVGATPDGRTQLGAGSPQTPAPPAPSTSTTTASNTTQGGLAPPHHHHHHDKEKRSGSFSKRFSSLGFGKRSSVAHEGKDESYAASQRPASNVPAAATQVQHNPSTGATAVQKTAVDSQGNVAQHTTVAQPTTASNAGTVGRTGATESAAGSEFGTVGKQHGSAITSSTATQVPSQSVGAAGGSDFLNKDPAVAQQHPQVKKKKSGFFSKLKHAFSHKG